MNRKMMIDAVLEMSEYNRFSKGIFGWVGFRTKWLEYENGTGGVPDSFCEDERLSDGSQCGVPGSVCLSDGCLAEKTGGLVQRSVWEFPFCFYWLGPMIYQSCHQIMFVQYMPFLMLALLGNRQILGKGKDWTCIHWACF